MGFKKSSIITWMIYQIFISSVSCGAVFQPLQEKASVPLQMSTSKEDFPLDIQKYGTSENLLTKTVDYLHNKVDYLSKQSILLSQFPANEDTSTLKAGFEKELMRFEGTIENLMKSGKTEISKLAYYFIESQKNDVNGLSESRVRQDHILGLGLSHISNEKLTSAILEFNKLKNESVVDKIKKMYNHNVSNIKKTISYINKINCDDQQLAAETLIDFLKEDSYIRNDQFLYFTDLNTNKNCFKNSFVEALSEYENEVIESMLYQYKRELLPNVLNLDEKFPDALTIKLFIYSQAFDHMEKNNDLSRQELILLVNKIWLLDQHCSSMSESAECKKINQELSSLIGKLPPGVHSLLWDTIAIENVLINGYRITTTGNEVFTYPASPTEFQHWNGTSVEGGLYFQFQTMTPGFVLYGSGDNLMAGYNTGEERLWKVVPGDKAQYFYLQNKVTNKAIDVNALVDCSASSSGKCSHPYVHDISLSNSHQQWKIEKFS